jgi:hypothetical protein
MHGHSHSLHGHAGRGAAPVPRPPVRRHRSSSNRAAQQQQKQWHTSRTGSLLLAAAAAGAGAGAAGGMGLLGTMQAMAQAVAALALLAAAVPSLLSTPAGTRLLCGAASRVLPGDVTLRRLQADLFAPLSLEGLEIFEGRDDPGGAPRRLLVSIGRLTTAEPLFRVLWGGGVTLTVAEPSVDVTLSDDGLHMRLVQHFRAARLWNALFPPTAVAAAAVGVPVAAGADGGGGRDARPSTPLSAAGVLPSELLDGELAAALVGSSPLATAAATAGGSPASSVAGSAVMVDPSDARSDGGWSESDAELSQQQLMDMIQLKQQGQPGTPTQGQQEGQQAEPARREHYYTRGLRARGAKLAAAVDGAIDDALAAGVGALRRRMAAADAAAGFSLELHAELAEGRRLQAVVSGGKLLVPREVREAVGRHVHGTIALGAEDVRQLAEEGGEDSAWVGPHGAHAPHGGGSVDDDDDAPSEAAAASGRRQPLALQIDSERLMVGARGWAGGGRFELQRPLEARADLTPEFAR